MCGAEVVGEVCGPFADLQLAARLIGMKAIAKIMMQFVSGIKTPEEVRIQALHIESPIAHYITSMFNIKQEIGAARIAILTKSFEFVRLIYSCQGSDIVFIIMHTCQ